MRRRFAILPVLLAALAFPLSSYAASGRLPSVGTDAPQLTEEQFREFLRNAKVLGYRQTSKGKTAPFRLTLSDGQRTLEACFQSIDEFKLQADLDSGTEVNFRDSFHYNIAAFELAKLLALGDMIPPTVEYKWRGNQGSLCWWVPVKMDEQERLQRNLSPPDVNDWNKQMNRMWVFSELVYDTDRNQTNMLISEDWKLWVIDFSRAFRRHRQPRDLDTLEQCDRQLLERLRQLDEAEVLQKTKPHLKKREVRALMARRDKLVAHFERLIAQKGEDKVLY